MGASVDSASALCQLTVSEVVLSSDLLLQLVAKLASPLQLKLVKKKKTDLQLVVNGQDSVVLTQRNAILRSLAGLALHGQLDSAPYYLLAGSCLSNKNATTAAAATGSILSWMSLTDSMRPMSADVQSILPGLTEHLERSSFLVPSAGQCTLADLDLAVVLMKKQMDYESYPAPVMRWLRVCHATLQQYCQEVDIPASDLPTSPPPVAPKTPIFFYGNEDMDIILAQLQNKKDKKKSQAGAAAGAAAAASASSKQQQQKGKQQQQHQQQQQGKANKKQDKQQCKKQPQQQQQQPASYDITALDIRVGKITKVWPHESAEKLFCEEIDLGTEQRQIASGLRPFYNKEELQDATVLVLCNLKARKLVGFASHGMVLCASNADHSAVELVIPPADTALGERVTFEGYDATAPPEAENKVAKKKVFEGLAPDLKTNENGHVVWKGAVAKTSKGVVVASKGMVNASVS